MPRAFPRWPACGRPQPLYQLGATDLTRVQFMGGHGFTGLHFVDHEGSQLQFWCTAS